MNVYESPNAITDFVERQLNEFLLRLSFWISEGVGLADAHAASNSGSAVSSFIIATVTIIWSKMSFDVVHYFGLLLAL